MTYIELVKITPEIILNVFHEILFTSAKALSGVRVLNNFFSLQREIKEEHTRLKVSPLKAGLFQSRAFIGSPQH
jgi:hypothetical protein